MKRLSESRATPGSYDLMPPVAIHAAALQLQQPPAQSIVYIKIPKTGSSTFAGVLHRAAGKLQLAGADSCRLQSWSREPLLWAEHGSYVSIADEVSRMRMHPLLITLVRDPVERCLSHYYYSLRTTPSAQGAITFMKKNCNEQHTKMLALSKSLPAPNSWAKRRERDANATSVMSLLPAFDFVGVAERFDESVVMLASLLGVDDDDVAYMPVKVADGQERHDGAFVHTHRHTPWAQEDPAVRRYAASAEFQQANQMDYELHTAATARLDAFYAAPENRARLAHFKERREQLVAAVHDEATGAVDLDAAHRTNLIFGCETKRGEWGK